MVDGLLCHCLFFMALLHILLCQYCLTHNKTIPTNAAFLEQKTRIHNIPNAAYRYLEYNLQTKNLAVKLGFY